MAKYVIVPIVEGDGELEAVPILLRNWLKFRGYRNVDVHVGGPVVANGKGNLTAPYDRSLNRGIEHFVPSAMRRQPQLDIILILLDADEDCPKILADSLLARARTQVPPDFPIGVVVANQKYEAWFLAAFASLRFRHALERQGYRLRRRSLPPGMDVEANSRCEARLESLIDFSGGGSTGRYKKTLHQQALTEHLPFTPIMSSRSRSFRKLLKELQELLRQARRRRKSSTRRGPS